MPIPEKKTSSSLILIKYDPGLNPLRLIIPFVIFCSNKILPEISYTETTPFKWLRLNVPFDGFGYNSISLIKVLFIDVTSKHFSCG